MRKRNNNNEINEIRSLNSHTSGVNKVRFTSDGNYCVSCSDDRTIKLWNPHKEDNIKEGNSLLIKTYSGVHGYQVLDIHISNVCSILTLFNFILTLFSLYFIG